MALSKIRLKAPESTGIRRFKDVNLRHYFSPTGMKIFPINGVYETSDPWEILTLEYFEALRRDLVEEIT